MSATLYYVADPMCAWCWGFQKVLHAVEEAVPESTSLTYVMGGLAKDNDEPMPEETRGYIQNAWREVSSRTGVTFNWDFWETCKPRRSTYPACRAFYAAQAQHPQAGPAMFEAIQRAYYQEARNPSDQETLIELANNLTPRLDAKRFAEDLASPEIETRLQDGFTIRRTLNANQFPSLVYQKDEAITFITKGYSEVNLVLEKLDAAMA